MPIDTLSLGFAGQAVLVAVSLISVLAIAAQVGIHLAAGMNAEEYRSFMRRPGRRLAWCSFLAIVPMVFLVGYPGAELRSGRDQSAVSGRSVYHGTDRRPSAVGPKVASPLDDQRSTESQASVEAAEGPSPLGSKENRRTSPERATSELSSESEVFLRTQIKEVAKSLGQIKPRKFRSRIVVRATTEKLRGTSCELSEAFKRIGARSSCDVGGPTELASDRGVTILHAGDVLPDSCRDLVLHLAKIQVPVWVKEAKIATGGDLIVLISDGSQAVRNAAGGL